MDFIKADIDVLTVYAFDKATQIFNHFAAKCGNITVYPDGYSALPNYPIDPKLPSANMIFRTKLPHSVQSASNIIIQLTPETVEIFKHFLLSHSIVVGKVVHIATEKRLTTSIEQHKFNAMALYVQRPFPPKFVEWAESLDSRSAFVTLEQPVTMNGKYITSESIKQNGFKWLSTGVYVNPGDYVDANCNVMIGPNLPSLRNGIWYRFPDKSQVIDHNNLKTTAVERGGILYCDEICVVSGIRISSIHNGFKTTGPIDWLEINQDSLRFTFPKKSLSFHHRPIVTMWTLIHKTMLQYCDAPESLWFVCDKYDKVTRNGMVCTTKSLDELAILNWKLIMMMLDSYMSDLCVLSRVQLSIIIWIQFYPITSLTEVVTDLDWSADVESIIRCTSYYTRSTFKHFEKLCNFTDEKKFIEFMCEVCKRNVSALFFRRYEYDIDPDLRRVY